MTTKEFSNEFDTLINSYSVINNYSAPTPSEFDEYEKSVLLTQAQEDLVKGLYNGSFNGLSLERTEELRRYLDGLVITDTPTKVIGKSGIDKRSVFFELKEDVWFITYESADLNDGYYCPNNPTVRVVPMRQDEWNRVKENPFRSPNKRKVVRLDNGSNVVELISSYPISKYLIRYIKKPDPIILTPLEGTLSINGIQEVTECKLNTVLHRTILERAVQLASRRIPRASE